MEAPRRLRGVLRELERQGFVAVACEPRKGSHWAVTFRGISTPQIMTSNGSEPRAMKNHVARLKRLMAEGERGEVRQAQAA